MMAEQFPSFFFLCPINPDIPIKLQNVYPNLVSQVSFLTSHISCAAPEDLSSAFFCPADELPYVSYKTLIKTKTSPLIFTISFVPRDAENKKAGYSTGRRSGTAFACGSAGYSNPHAHMLFRIRRDEGRYGI
jgi:hypothetical protein